MGGFLSGLGTLLGGFNTARRIDTEGFDFREKQAAQQFERDRRVEQARQADEDRSVNIGRDILLGQEEGEEEPDLSQIIPGALTKLRVRGAVAQSKPALEAQKQANQFGMLRIRGRQQERQIGLRGDVTQSLARVRASLEAGEQPSPRDKYIAEQASKRTGMTVDAMLKRAKMGGAGGRPLTADEYNPETGMTERKFYTPEQARGMAESGTGIPRLGASEQNRRGAARASIESGQQLLTEIDTPDFVSEVGPVMGRYNSLSAAAGAGDPYAQYLVGSLRSFAALQPQIHGFRAVQFVEDIEKLLSTKQTPQSLAAGLEGIMTASYIVSGQQQPRPGFLQKADDQKVLQSLAQELASLSPEERAALLGGRQ